MKIDEIRTALKKDFHELYREGYCTDWKTKRFIRDTEIEIMKLNNLSELFGLENEGE